MRIVTSMLVIPAVALLAVTASVAGQTRQELMKSSNIVFSGKVTAIGAASFEAVPADPQSLVVEVDQVLQKPQSVMLRKGDSVTLRSQSAEGLSVGTEAVFYTNGWVYGAGLAVLEVGRELLGQGAAGEAPTLESMSPVQQQIDDEALKERLDAAEIVVVGRVTQVRAGTPDTTEGATTTTMISEHSPNWQEAVIEVTTALKGAQAGQQVVVRFPASRDIQWYFAPKFQEGQTGTFILTEDEVSGVANVTLEGAQKQTFTALNPEDVMGVDQAERVRRLLNP